MVFNPCERKKERIVVWEEEHQYLCQQSREAEQAAAGSWTETLGWGEKTREDGQFRMRNLGRHIKGMGSSRVGEIEFFSCSHIILSWDTLGVSGQARAEAEGAGGCLLHEGAGGMGLHWNSSTLFTQTSRHSKVFGPET